MTGKVVKIHKPDVNGGFIPGGTDALAFPVDDITTANPGASTVLPAAVLTKARSRVPMVLGAGPWTATIAGVTGADEASINGSRTITRVGDHAVSIGVDTTLLTYVATAATITGITYVENDARFPSKDSNDWIPE